ncbi:MAG: M28 family peptidase [Ardenticatenia bacterium]|nr:M28 family peptidase [Ardenticatenia bacterium]
MVARQPVGPWWVGVLLFLVACQAVTPSPAAPASSTPVPVSPSPRSRGQFDGARALEFARAQCAIGPRPTGSEALLRTRAWIEQQLVQAGWEVVRQETTYRGLPIRNVVGVWGEGRPVMVGAHYDTRPRADQDPISPESPIVGGNDGASGVAVLVELAYVLDIPDGLQVQLAFFDAEDRGTIDGWPFAVGASQMVADFPRGAARSHGPGGHGG